MSPCRLLKPPANALLTVSPATHGCLPGCVWGHAGLNGHVAPRFPRPHHHRNRCQVHAVPGAWCTVILLKNGLLPLPTRSHSRENLRCACRQVPAAERQQQPHAPQPALQQGQQPAAGGQVRPQQRPQLQPQSTQSPQQAGQAAHHHLQHLKGALPQRATPAPGPRWVTLRDASHSQHSVDTHCVREPPYLPARVQLPCTCITSLTHIHDAQMIVHQRCDERKSTIPARQLRMIVHQRCDECKPTIPTKQVSRTARSIPS